MGFSELLVSGFFFPRVGQNLMGDLNFMRKGVRRKGVIPSPNLSHTDFASERAQHSRARFLWEPYPVRQVI